MQASRWLAESLATRCPSSLSELQASVAKTYKDVRVETWLLRVLALDIHRPIFFWNRDVIHSVNVNVFELTALSFIEVSWKDIRNIMLHIPNGEDSAKSRELTPKTNSKKRFYNNMIQHKVIPSRTRLHKSRSSRDELEFDLSNFV